MPGNIADSREFGTTFDPFFVFSFVPVPAEDDLPAGWPSQPLALHFLHEEVESCPDFHREFIDRPARGARVFRARAERIADLARVVTAGGSSIMIGASSWVIPPEWHVPIIEFREKLRPRRLLTRSDLREYDTEIRRSYHQIVQAILHPFLPVAQEHRWRSDRADDDDLRPRGDSGGSL